MYEAGTFGWMAFGRLSLKLQYATSGWINTTSSFKQQTDIQENRRLQRDGERNFHIAFLNG